MLRPLSLVLFALLAACAKKPAPPSAALPWQKPGDPTFAGRSACVKCHEKEDAKWALSDHARAMQPMNEKTVLADFGGTTFTYHGVTSTFTMKDGKYFVRTDGPDGRLAAYEIAWAFGIRPLQQYLIRFPRGRVQALNVCWDTRPREKGASAGSTSTRTRTSRTRTSSTGPAPTRTGTPCAPTATRRT